MSGCICELDVAAIGDNIVQDLPHHQNGIPFSSASAFSDPKRANLAEVRTSKVIEQPHSITDIDLNE